MVPNDQPVVLQVLAPADFGGLERVVVDLTRGLRARGWPLHVLAFVDVGRTDHPVLVNLRAADVPLTGVEVPPRDYHVERSALRRVITETGARLVHTHGARADVVDGGAARRWGLATVSTLHGFTGGRVKNRLYEWLQRRAVRRFDAVIAVSRPMAIRLRACGVPPERLHVVPNAWVPAGQPLGRDEARRVLGLPSDALVVGWVGRVTPEKGPDVFLEALGRVREPAFVASIIGTGRDRSRLEARARVLGLERRIIWHGMVPSAGRLFAAFDVFVLSSRTEGTPIVLFEAMAAGVPVVAARVGGVPDVVTEREARLVEPEDPAAIAAAVRDLLEHRSDGRRLARAGVERLRTVHAAGPWLDAYEALYRRVVGWPPGAAEERRA